MGSITFDELLRYGLAQISSAEFAGMVNALFATGSRPVCYTMF
jgi:hypothetical protein